MSFANLNLLQILYFFGCSRNKRGKDLKKKKKQNKPILSVNAALLRQKKDTQRGVRPGSKAP